jgi:hypothetical protein
MSDNVTWTRNSNLVDDDVSKGAKDARLASHQRPEKDSVGAEGEQCSWRNARLEPNLISDGCSDLKIKVVTIVNRTPCR